MPVGEPRFRQTHQNAAHAVRRHIKAGLVRASARQDATHKARPMLAAPAVLIAPDPAPARRISAEEHCYLPGGRMQQSPVGFIPTFCLILLGGNSQSGGSMLPGQPSAQGIENARVALVVIVASIMLFGRALLRVAIAIFMVAAVIGAFMLLQGMHL